MTENPQRPDFADGDRYELHITGEAEVIPGDETQEED